MTEGQLQDAIRLALGRDPDLCLFRNNVGVLVDPHTNRRVRFGLCVGSADLVGIFRGRFVCLEIKTPTGRQTDEQRRFEALITSKGGIYAVVRSVDEALAWLADLRARVA